MAPLPRSRRTDPAPTLEVERGFWDGGLPLVAGVDEVGRGALAGPLVAAAVLLRPCDGAALRSLRAGLRGLRDSKLLRPEGRERLAARVRARAVAVGLGEVPAEELDEVGLAAANRLAMERAVFALDPAPDALVLDACVLDLGLPQIGPIRGDARCLSVAAASVVAKVHRDRLMAEHDARDGRYGFAVHKGYGTSAHLAALAAHGPCALHRRSFRIALPVAGGAP